MLCRTSRQNARTLKHLIKKNNLTLTFDNLAILIGQGSSSRSNGLISLHCMVLKFKVFLINTELSEAITF